MAKCRSSTPVRNKEQKIDRLLSFMFLRGKAARLVRPFVRLLILPRPTSASPFTPTFSVSWSLSFVWSPCSSLSLSSLPLFLFFFSSRRTIRRIEEILHGALWEKNHGTRRKTQKGAGKREEERGRDGEEGRYGAGGKGRKIGERPRDTCTRKKSKSLGSVDGIAFVVCYRSSGFFGWE